MPLLFNKLIINPNNDWPYVFHFSVFKKLTKMNKFEIFLNDGFGFEFEKQESASG